MRAVSYGILFLFFLLLPTLRPFAKDLGDYPLQVEILWNHHESYNFSPGTPFPTFLYKANGRGNVRDGSTVQGFDFEYRGSTDLGATPPDTIFHARWKKPQVQIELLMPVIGHEGKYVVCQMDTLIRKGVYVRSSQGVIEISQEDYKAGKSPAPASGASLAHPQSTTPAKLTINSNPGSADIEVDGEFVGTTPSVLQLNPGEHTIVVHKAAYKPWQRKMKIVTGEITVNADLELESPK
jgi:hypothetical protein